MTMTTAPTTTSTARAPSWVKNEPLIAWVAEMAELCNPESIHWCDGSAAESERLSEQMISAGTLKRLNPALRPNSFLALSDPERRRPGRGPHLHLQPAEAGRRPDEQLGRPEGDAADAAPAVRRVHAGPDDVRHSLLHGTAGIAAGAVRRGAERLALRGGEHAAHDAHGPRRARRAGRWRVRAVHALGGQAAGARGARRVVALQHREVHRALPG